MNNKILLAFAVVMLGGCAATTGTSADKESVCKPIAEEEVAGLFERWNSSLQTGDPKVVVGNYADHSILLPTLSGKNRITKQEKEDYFKHFLVDKPVGTVTARQIHIGCNMAVDSGLYTFAMARTGQQTHARYSYTYTWGNGQWLIVSHHSSVVPEP